MDKEEAKRLVEVDESVRQSITENEKQLVETRFYKEFVINTEKGPLVLNDVYITVERNKENDMEYHFRWVQENEDGEATLEEKLMIDKDGKAFSIEAFEDFLQDLTLDGEILK